VAIFNEILSGRYNRALQKVFCIKGHPPVRQLGGEIMPVHAFYNGIENRAPEEWFRFGVGTIQGAAALPNAAVRLRNPPNSNRLVVLEKITIASIQTAIPQFILETATTTADLTTAVLQAIRWTWDKRLDGVSPMVITSQSSAPLLNIIRCVACFPAQNTYDFITEEQHEQVLSPGEAIQCRCATATDMAASFWWRERKFEPEEFNLGN
jgi:hypothetical protein